MVWNVSNKTKTINNKISYKKEIKMKTKNMTTSAILLSIGLLLHYIIPGIPFLGGMKMDFLLAMMFISIFMQDDIKGVLAISLTAGIISALTTTFPGGQPANIVDKIITGPFVYYFYMMLQNVITKNKGITKLITSFISTIVSGSTFLIVALSINKLPLSFVTLFLTIVIPASILNTVGIMLIDKVLSKSKSLVNA